MNEIAAHCLTFWKRTGKMVALKDLKPNDCFYCKDALSIMRVVEYLESAPKVPFRTSYVCEVCYDVTYHRDGAKYRNIFGMTTEQVEFVMVELVEKHTEWLSKSS